LVQSNLRRIVVSERDLAVLILQSQPHSLLQIICEIIDLEPKVPVLREEFTRFLDHKPNAAISANFGQNIVVGLRNWYRVSVNLWYPLFDIDAVPERSKVVLERMTISQAYDVVLRDLRRKNHGAEVQEK
jgi:hypothetical protein